MSFPRPRAVAAVQRDPGFARVADLVPASARRILHFGCGRGIAALLLKIREPSRYVCGVPDDPALGPEASQRCDEILALPSLGSLAPGSFDCIVASSVLDHSPDPEAALRLLLRSLAPGGHVVVEAPSAARHLLESVRSGAKHPKKRGFTRRQLLDLLEECGCEVTSLRLDLERSTPPRPIIAIEGARRLDQVEESFAPRIFATAVYAETPARIPVCSVIVLPGPGSARTIAALRRERARTDLDILVAEGRSAADLNRATRSARGRYLGFVEAGTVPQAGWLAALIRALTTTPHAGVAGSAVYSADRRLLHAGFALTAFDLPYRHYPLPLRTLPAGESGLVPSAGVNGMLLERRLFIRNAGFDERFEHDLFDADLCLRLRAYGRLVVCSSQSVLRAAAGPATLREEEPPGHRHFGDKWSPLLESTRLGEPVREAPVQPKLPSPTGAARAARPALVWSGHIFGASGYAESTRSFVAALDRAGVSTFANPFSSDTPSTFDEAIDFDRFVISRPPKSFVSIVSRPGIFCRRQMQERIAIGRTMNETDRIPTGWVSHCNQMDQIWVPSRFNLEAFARSGVDRRRLFVVPETIDERQYHGHVEPLAIDSVSGFVFLSVFVLGPRKGWKFLLEAYLDEFRHDEDVTLLLRVSPSMRSPLTEITDFVASHLGGDPSRGPRVVLCPATIGAALMPRLFRTAHAFALPSRGEGWGRPYMEAMASGLPTIGTGWSGNTEFMDADNSYLLDYELVPHNDPSLPVAFHTPEHTLWALPSVAHLRTLLRTVFENREAAAKVGARARESVLERFRYEKVANIVIERLREGGVDPAPARAAAAVPSPPVACSVVLIARDPVRTTASIEAIEASAPDIAWELVVVTRGSGRHGRYRSGRAQRTATEHVGKANLSAARNIGAKAAGGEFLVFLEDDSRPEPRWMEALLDAARSSADVSAAGSTLVARDGTLLHAGLAHGDELVPYPLHRGLPREAGPVRQLREVPAVSGTGMIVSRKHFCWCGGFDESLTGRFADADLCRRLREVGRTTVFAPGSIVVCDPVAEPGARDEHDARNRFLEKWAPSVRPDDEAICRQDRLDPIRVRANEWPMPARGSRRTARSRPAVLWSAPVFDRSGYANEARDYVLALADAGIDVAVNAQQWPLAKPDLAKRVAERLRELATRELPEDFVHVFLHQAIRFSRHSQARRNIGRTMFETDSLPRDRVESCNAMDEIWVPSRFNVETFARAGVDKDKLVVIPEALDADLYRKRAKPFRIPDARGFVFLSVFAWSVRKGCDVLLRAWVEEFARSEDVTLVLGVSTSSKGAPVDPAPLVAAHLRDVLGCDPSNVARIVVLPLALAPEDMPGLYAAADAFVLPSRGEGWGRPYMEAMASGLPTIGTGWSGNTEFMNEDNSFLIESELVELPEKGWARPGMFRGQRWAEPSVGHLRALMRRVYEDRAGARSIGKRARKEVLELYDRRRIARMMIERTAPDFPSKV